jgi:phospholipase/lecithinase/hemolysin
MRKYIMKRNATKLVRSIGSLAFALIAGSSQAGDVSAVVVFGDSLSDSGNHFIAFGETATQPFEPVPSGSYAIGGHHFSNGSTWIEQLVAGSSAAPSARPALSRSERGSNYAVGRARARANAAEFPDYDLSTQVGLFLADHEGEASSGDLYVLWIGANDVRDALVALATGGGSLASQLAAQQILGAAIQAIGGNIVALYSSGAREFLVGNVPNPAHTPVVRALGAGAQGAATYLSGAFNGGLGQMLLALGQLLPGATFAMLDADAVLQGIIADPDGSGFADVTRPCLDFGVTGHAICAIPGSHLFWDGTHPTSAGHGAIAAAAATVLATQ